MGQFQQLHLAQARATLDQEVERGGDPFAVEGEVEDLERLELAEKRRDAAEAAEDEHNDAKGLISKMTQTQYNTLFVIQTAQESFILPNYSVVYNTLL